MDNARRIEIPSLLELENSSKILRFASVQLAGAEEKRAVFARSFALRPLPAAARPTRPRPDGGLGEE
jgi:hypothetical protein